jgi:hypothetical protein
MVIHDRYDLVYIEWEDAASYNKWYDDDSDFHTKWVITVGHLIRDYKDSIAVAQSVTLDTFTDVIVIPKSIIKHKLNLRVQKGKRGK